MGAEKTRVEFGVELGSAQNTERDDVEPEEKGYAGAQGAVDLRVVGESRDIPTEDDGGEKPHGGGDEGSRKGTLPGLLHGSSHVIDEGGDADAASERNAPSDKEGKDKYRGTGRGCDVESEPVSDEVSKDHEDAGQREGNEREGDQNERSQATLPEGPAVEWEVIRTAQAFHDGGQDAGGAKEAHERRNAQGVGGTDGLR